MLTDPTWLPESEQELLDAARNGLLEEGHGLDIKRELQTGKSANKEVAKDVASFAIDGGLLLFGVDEDQTPPALRALPLSGLAERLEQIALLAVTPPLHITTAVIPSAVDPALGYLVVRVPASAAAPHMVDGRYYARSDKTKFVLSDEQVLVLHEQRLRSARDIEEQAVEVLRKSPVAAETGMVAVVARPLAAPRPLLREFAAKDSWAEGALRMVQAVAGSPGYAPAMNQATTATRRPYGFALTAGLDPYRQVEASPRPDRAVRRIIEVVFEESGVITLLSARAVDEEHGHKMVFDKLIAGVSDNIVGLARAVAVETGYQGAWGLALVAEGLQGGTSWELDSLHSSGYPYTEHQYKASTRASFEELDQAASAVSARLVRPLLRALGSERAATFSRFSL